MEVKCYGSCKIFSIESFMDSPIKEKNIFFDGEDFEKF